MYKQQLELLLNESIKNAEERSKNLFHSTLEANPLILYGCGNLGRKVARCLLKSNYKIACFVDKNSEMHGKTIEGIPVLSVGTALEKYGNDSVFLITIFNREFSCDYNVILNELKSQGVQNCMPFAYVGWAFAKDLLPHFNQGVPSEIIKDKEHILEAFTFLNVDNDSRSKEVFLEMAKTSLTADFENFSRWDEDPTYFGREVDAVLNTPIHMADCGAYDGDTLRLFLEFRGEKMLGSWHAFEPDPKTFKSLQEYVASLPKHLQEKIYCYNYAIGNENITVTFSADNSESGHVVVDEPHTATNLIQVKQVRLDDVLQKYPINFIKMDIEGYEAECLIGAHKILSEQKPTLAISIYHKPDDFYSLPLQIKPYYKDAQFVMRRYMAYAYEAVLYVV